MIRRLLRRFLIASALFVGLVVLSIVVAGLLAIQTPGFYAERLELTSSTENQAAAEEHWKQTARSYKQWLNQSIAIQQPRLTNTTASNEPYDPSQDIHIMRVTEADINAICASKTFRSQGSMQNPRFRIRDNETELAFQLKSSSFECVISSVLKPELTDDGRLRLDILSARIGQLPIPLKTLIQCSPRELKHTEGGLEIDFTLPTPHITLQLFDHETHAAKPQSVHCMNGELVVQFIAPALNSKQASTKAMYKF